MTPYSYPGINHQAAHQLYAERHDQLPLESISTILNKVSKLYEIPSEVILSKTNKREVVYARFCVMWCLRKYLGLTLTKIAYSVGKKEHSSVLHGINAYEDMLNMIDKQSRVIQARHNELTEYFNRVFK